ncbi:beta-class carbonic anhydrase [Sporosarcina sp. ANT_H38]|uniref:beta-class carbonic anhydrase n=1 Tax=Sporosarcina sp. ANT_H38 TaxID=2597358 RepID=UPI0021075102|nr:carbonic anhydrase [Sporosarcina sp. ANT_H38]
MLISVGDKYEQSKSGSPQTRLVELLQKSMNLRNGDMKIVKSAGAIVNHPFGSILFALYELHAEELFIVGHYDCGMSAVDPDIMIEHMKERGISDETFDILKYSSHDIDSWLRGFGDVKSSVLKSCEVVRNHPLLAKTIPVHGLVMDPQTGLFDLLSDGMRISNKQIKHKGCPEKNFWTAF